VLEIWEEQRKENAPLLVHPNSSRYFVLIGDVCEKIIDCLDSKEIFFLKECLKIKITDLQNAFSEYYNYWKTKEYKGFDVEKVFEEISPEIGVFSPRKEEIVNLLKNHLEKK
jgi:FlaA1/EpsC-like NDP-sugar epimerase